MSQGTLHEESALLKVRFDPPLWLQRRTWALTTLRQEEARKVLDIGCGDASLLSILCEPPSTVHETPVFPPEETLYLDRIAGLDVCTDDLEAAKKNTEPWASTEVGHYLRERIRWDPLHVDLWQGSLDVYNPAFHDYEIFVCTEVIEHLPPTILDQFAPVILGRYRPRLLLLTTPNFTFNARFTKPGHVDPHGFLDPSGRTARVYRHSDHKFEWTEQEFTQWCRDAASSHGYDVEVSGVGLALDDDPYGRPSVFASQTALFRRHHSDGPGSEAPANLTTPSLDHSPHLLFASFIHAPHPLAGQLVSPSQLRKSVQDVMQHFGYEKMSFQELWNNPKIPFSCGGSLRALVDALQQNPATWILDVTGTNDWWSRELTWAAFVSPLPDDAQLIVDSLAEERYEDVYDEAEVHDWSDNDRATGLDNAELGDRTSHTSDDWEGQSSWIVPREKEAVDHYDYWADQPDGGAGWGSPSQTIADWGPTRTTIVH